MVFLSLRIVVLALIEPLARIFLPLRSWMLLLSLTFEVTRTLFFGSQVIVSLTLRVRSRRIADLIFAGDVRRVRVDVWAEASRARSNSTAVGTTARCCP